MRDLKPTQAIGSEALNNARLNSMLETLQQQREALANEVVKVRSELAMCELKLESEIQVSRSMQVSLAAARQTLDDVQQTLEVTSRTSAERWDRVIQLEADLQRASAVQTSVTAVVALSTSQVPELTAISGICCPLGNEPSLN